MALFPEKVRGCGGTCRGRFTESIQAQLPSGFSEKLQGMGAETYDRVREQLTGMYSQIS
jgi:hypothetical protein